MSQTYFKYSRMLYYAEIIWSVVESCMICFNHFESLISALRSFSILTFVCGISSSQRSILSLIQKQVSLTAHVGIFSINSIALQKVPAIAEKEIK